MVLSTTFRETIQARAQSDAAFRRAMLSEAVNELLAGALDAGKAMLRDYINATIGFTALSNSLGKSSKSLQRMLGPKGNPRADNIFAIIRVLQDADDVRLQVKITKSKAA